MAFIDAKAKLTKGKETLRVLEGWASRDRSAMGSTINESDCMQGKFVTTFAELQFAKRALTAAFDDLKRHSSNLRAVGSVVQERMKSQLAELHSDGTQPSKPGDKGASVECRCQYLILGNGVSTRY